MKKNKSTSDIEKRTALHPVEMRAAESTDDHITVEGYAFLWNSRTDMGWYDEVILPGAVTQEEIDQMDVRCMLDHTVLLARSNKGSGTLTLTVDQRGLHYSFELPTTVHAEFIHNLRSNNITQSSFAFSIEEQRWIEREGENELRELVRFKQIYDVAPVTYPAYEDTTVAMRSKELIEEREQKTLRQSQHQSRERTLQLMEMDII